jgi:hypothetical protein
MRYWQLEGQITCLEYGILGYQVLASLDFESFIFCKILTLSAVACAIPVSFMFKSSSCKFYFA